MNNQDYNQKKRECLQEFCKLHDCETPHDYIVETFDFAFDRAFALGKQFGNSEQVDVEKAAERYADEIRIPASIPGIMVPFINGIAHDSYLQGAQDCLGKQKKDAEDTVIQGWVARDNGKRSYERELHLFTNKPERRTLRRDWFGLPSMSLDSKLFPDLTWHSEPLEVEIIIKRTKK